MRGILRSAIALLALGWPSPGQITPASPYSGIVATRLDSAQWLLRAVQDSNDDFTAALNRAALSGDELGDWKDAAWKEAQARVDRGIQALVKLLQSEIAAEKDFLDNLHRSPNATAIDTVAGNLEALEASVQSQRVIAGALSALVQLMEAHSEAALGLPKPVRDRLGQWEGTLDRTVEMFESNARACRNRADEYQSALDDLRNLSQAGRNRQK